MKKSSNGYSLIELSISLTIIALLITGGLGIVSKTSEAKRYRITSENIRKIEEALAAFEGTNMFLPCPAQGLSIESNAAFGVAASYDTTTHGCSISSVSGVIDQTGMVPVRTLNIPDSLAYDGWGHKLTYRLASGLGSSTDFANAAYVGDLHISDIAGNEKTNINNQPPNNMGAAYVIISNGPNAGNIPRSNIALLDTAATGRSQENRDHYANKVYVQSDRTFDFGDIVAYKQKSDFHPLQAGVSPINIPGYVCSNAKSLASGTTLDTLKTTNAALAAQVETSARTLQTLCNNPASLCSITPKSVASDNLQVWLDANDPNNNGTTPTSWGTSLSGTSHSNDWQDKSGHARGAVNNISAASSRPQYVTNVLNSKPVMRFSGSVFFNIDLAFLKNSPYTIFTVHTRSDNNGPNYVLGANLPTLGLNYGYNATNPNLFQLGQSDTDIISTFALPYRQGAPILSVGMLDTSGRGKTIRATMDGISYTNGFDSQTTGITTNFTDPSISGSIGSGMTLTAGHYDRSYFRGDIAEVIIYNVSLSTNDRTAIEGYLHRKWISGDCP